MTSIGQAQRNKAQASAFKTMGGRGKYFACAKPWPIRYGVFAVAVFGNRGFQRVNGHRQWL